MVMALGAVAIMTACSDGGSDTPDPVEQVGIDSQGSCTGIQVYADNKRVEFRINCTDSDGIDFLGETGHPAPYIEIDGKKTQLSSVSEEHLVRNVDGVVTGIIDWQLVCICKANHSTTGKVVMWSVNGESGEYKEIESKPFTVHTVKDPVKSTPPSIIGTWKTECVVDNNISLNNIVIFMDDNTYTTVENEFYNKECKGIGYDTYEDKGKYKLGKATKSYQGKDVFEIDITSDDDSKTSYFMIDISKTYIELAFALNGKDMDEDEDGGTSPDKRFNDFSANLKFYKD